MQINDEKLTAYVLGELDDQERAAVAAALQDDADARQTVAELQATIGLAEQALSVEPQQGLSDQQRDSIRERAEAAAAPAPSKRRTLGWIMAAAALLLVGGVGIGTMRLMMSPGSEMFDMAGESVVRPDPAYYQHDTARDGVAIEEPTAAPEMEEQLRSLGYLTEDEPLDPSRLQVDGQAVDSGEGEPGFIHDPAENHAPGHDTEAYDHITDNPFMDARGNPLSTFSIDVDTASYSNVRRFLTQNTMPPAGSVRIEELVNYFSYDYEPPAGDDPFTSHVEVAGCPWAPQHRLARIGLKGWELPRDERPATNLVFLIDVSGSMSTDSKLPLLKEAMKMLVQQLDERDRVAIAVYAGSSGLVLPSTSCDDKRAIVGALDRLESGGSTNGGAGIQLAYDTAVANFIDGGVNRVILATDGDFNVGTTSRSELIDLIEDRAKSGTFLTVMGFGMGNYKDGTLEQIADKGNGNYAYIDTLNEAEKVLVHDMMGTLVTIAKDVKIQVEFNPSQVQAYRLIGYENRILAAEDFNDDTKDAGEIGAGHTVTALYEIVPVGVAIDLPDVDELRYQQPKELSPASHGDELMTLKLRYKQPDGDKSKLLTFPVTDSGASYASASGDFKFAASVAAFGMILRDSPHKGSATYEAVLELGGEGKGEDRFGYRAEFLELVKKAKQLSR